MSPKTACELSLCKNAWHLGSVSDLTVCIGGGMSPTSSTNYASDGPQLQRSLLSPELSYRSSLRVEGGFRTGWRLLISTGVLAQSRGSVQLLGRTASRLTGGVQGSPTARGRPASMSGVATALSSPVPVVDAPAENRRLARAGLHDTAGRNATSRAQRGARYGIRN